jgi:hypothetical protein
MTPNLAAEVAALRQMTVNELRSRFAELFGEPTRASNRTWLVRRLAWRMQALAEGDLSERAKRRAAELANDADLRVTAPRTARAATPASEASAAPSAAVDSRLPRPGTVITRRYKGTMIQVQVLAESFACDGQVYPSLSAVAKAITGTHCNGYHFFRLTRQGGKS